MDMVAAPPPGRRHTLFLVNAAAVLERCDEQMLPAVYRWLGASWGATPTQLGFITLCRALVQALSSPLGGIAGYCVHRGRVLGAGCLLWSACTAGFTACDSLGAGAAVWAVNGFGLALVLPSAQSLVADLHKPGERGRAFGTLYATAAMGGMLGALYATNLGAHTPLGIEGWRFAFLSLAVVSGATGAANFLLTVDPQRQGQQQQQQLRLIPSSSHQGSLSLLQQEQALQQLPALASAAGAPAGPEDEEEAAGERQRLMPANEQGSFGRASSTPVLAGCFVHKPGLPAQRQREAATALPLAARIWQGIAGSVPWSALVFLTLYFQLLGMSDAHASFLVALFLAGTAAGGLLGGCVGDAAAARWPHHGRIAVTQFSVAVGIPFACLVFKGLPRDGATGTVVTYALVLLAFALLKAWPAPACNNPVFAEIVPARQRNLVYAFDRCFEGAIAACAAPLVGLLAERWFGFSGSGAVSRDRQKDLANAAALGNALLAFLVVPWCFTLLLYSGLHFTYPADKAEALRRQRHELREQARELEERGVVIDRLSTATEESFIELPVPATPPEGPEEAAAGGPGTPEERLAAAAAAARPRDGARTASAAAGEEGVHEGRPATT